MKLFQSVTDGVNKQTALKRRQNKCKKISVEFSTCPFPRDKGYRDKTEYNEAAK
jgi:hypothetical protein